MIAFATPIKNRLWQFSQCFFSNLKVIERYPEVIWMVIDFNSTDGVDRFIKSQIKHDQVKFFRIKQEETFNIPKAKNIAAITAIDLGAKNVFSLDCDNFINDITVHHLKSLNKGFAIHQNTGEADGTWGRIGFNSEDFIDVNGYRENLADAHFQDQDLLNRLVKNGVKIMREPHYYPKAILNHKLDTIKNSDSAMTYAEMVTYNMKIVSSNDWNGPISRIPPNTIKIWE
jgi:predicted glycosyltransferase involved in capsule biosynthesis